MEKMLDVYKYTLDMLRHELALVTHGEQPSQRVIRKLKRRINYYQAYIALISSCLPVISGYFTQPIFVINRFWKEYCAQNNYCYETFPDASDFFEWFCHSNTIKEESSLDLQDMEGRETLYLSLLQVYPDWLFPDKCL